MSRIVIAVDPRQAGGVTCAVLKAPFQIPNLHTAHDTTIDDLVDLHGAEVVLRTGDGLAQRIRSNLKIDEVMQIALAHNGDESLPIFFRIGDDSAHALTWEALWANDKFLALERLWPVGRVPRGGDIGEDTDRVFEPPLRMAVVVSALGRPGLAEWQGIYERITEARAAGLPIHVTLFAAEDTVVGAAQAAADPALTLEPVPASGVDLIERLGALDPNLVHFFCHGAIVPGSHQLHIGTVTDWDANAEQSSVRVGVDHLGEELKASNVWAIVLNTCLSAAAQGDGDDAIALSHAEQLVIAGVPVAIGMRRLVNDDAASTFSKTFYKSAFEAIDEAVKGPKTIEWADTLLPARRALKDHAGAEPTEQDDWTLPILYTRSGTFRLLEPNRTAGQGREDAIAGLVALLGGDNDAFAAALAAIAPGQ